MRGILLIAGLLILGSDASAQIRPCSQWVWMKGDSASQQYGSYGNKGVPHMLNNPSCRETPAFWTDNEGNYWLFGGAQYDTSFNGTSSYGSYPLNDLWKYNPVSNEWAWMGGDNHRQTLHGVYAAPKGMPHPGNKPGARSGAASWTDKNGRFWMLGGNGIAASGRTEPYNQIYLNDLWMYDPATNQWTWMHGDSISSAQHGVYGTQGVFADGNKPGGRYGATTWVGADGSLWLFGGYGMASTSPSHVYVRGYLNDLWRYDIQTNRWSHEKGDRTIAGIWGGQFSRYGTQGQPAVGNNPGSRRESAGWTDANGNLWLFGGRGFNDTRDVADAQNDLWKYDPATRMWTWIKGAPFGAQAGRYGTRGVPAPGNNPGSRELCAAWVDEDDQFWLLGGHGGDIRGTGFTRLNDLWMYNRFTNAWVWINGDSLGNSIGQFGTPGIPNAANRPGSRRGPAFWIDSNKNFWVFGGQGIGSTYVYAHRNRDHLNDMWVFKATRTDAPQFTEAVDSLCHGSSAHYAVGSISGADAYIWNLPSGWSGVSTDTSIYATAGRSGMGRIMVRAVGVCDTSEAVEMPVYVYPFTAPLITVDGYRLGLTATYNTYQWYFNGNSISGATSAIYDVQENGSYTVVVTDANGCSDSSRPYQVTNLGIGQKDPFAASLTLYPNPAVDRIHIQGVDHRQVLNAEILTIQGREIAATKVEAGAIDVSALPAGVYFMRITGSGNRVIGKTKFIKINNN